MKSDPRKLKKAVRFEPSLAIGQPSKITKNSHLTSPLTLNEKLYLRSLTIPKITITRSGSGNLSEMIDLQKPSKLRKTVSLTDVKKSIDDHDLANQLASVGLTTNPWKDANTQIFDDNLVDTFRNIKILKKSLLQS